MMATTEYDETDIMRSDKIALSVFVDTVKIEITCKSEYEAQVLFDDLVDRMKSGQSITIEPGRAETNG